MYYIKITIKITIRGRGGLDVINNNKDNNNKEEGGGRTRYYQGSFRNGFQRPCMMRGGKGKNEKRRGDGDDGNDPTWKVGS